MNRRHLLAALMGAAVAPALPAANATHALIMARMNEAAMRHPEPMGLLPDGQRIINVVNPDGSHSAYRYESVGGRVVRVWDLPTAPKVQPSEF